MAEPKPTTSSGEEPDVAHVEGARDDMDDLTTVDGFTDGHRKSRYDDLSITRSLWIFKRVIIVSLAVYTGYVCEGFELGSSGTIIVNAGFIKQFGTGSGTGVKALSTTWVSTWSALLNIGQMITFTYVSWLADKFGRKAAFYVAWLWLALGCTFLNTAKSPPVWALAKLCSGAGVGVLQITCQVYIMEICPNRIRGSMIVFQPVWSGIGSIICSIMMQQINQKHPDNYLLAMRVLWGPIALMLVCWVFVPESPWFHARHGNKEKAIKAMKLLYGGVRSYDFEEEYAIIVRTIKHERDVLGCRTRYIDVFKGFNLKRTLTVMLLSACQQLVGLAIINTYSTYFFSLAGLHDPFLSNVILSCVNLFGIILWLLTIDKFGRRIIINSSMTLTCVVLFVVGSLYWAGIKSGNATTGTILLVICCLWGFLFQSVGMSYYLFSAELPSALLRTRTGPFTFLANSILGIATTYATPPMLLALNVRAGFVFGAFSVPICILMWLYVPETKGRSAAEIDELYERKVPAWRWSKTVTAVEGQMHAVVQMKSGIKEAQGHIDA